MSVKSDLARVTYAMPKQDHTFFLVTKMLKIYLKLNSTGEIVASLTNVFFSNPLSNGGKKHFYDKFLSIKTIGIAFKKEQTVLKRSNCAD